MSNDHCNFSSFFGFGSNPPKYLSIDRALIFHIHLGIHPETMHQKLMYYYLHLEETSITLEDCPHLFDRPLMIFLQTPYLTTGSYLSWVKLVMVKLVSRKIETGTIWCTK